MQKPERFISEKQVCSRVGISRVTLWRWQAEGFFPPRRQIGPRRVAWLESEIDTWMASRELVAGV